MPGMNMGHGGSMSGMDMSENIPGDGLLMAASGLSLKSATTSVPAGQSSAYRLQILGSGGKAVTHFQVRQTNLLYCTSTWCAMT